MLTSHLKDYSWKSALVKGKSQNTGFSRDLRFFLEKQFFSIIFFEAFFPKCQVLNKHDVSDILIVILSYFKKKKKIRS